MIRKPLKVLVCLIIPLSIITIPLAWGYNGKGVPAAPSLEAEVLSAEPMPRAVSPSPGAPLARNPLPPPPPPPPQLIPPPPLGILPSYRPPCQPPSLLGLFPLPGLPIRSLACDAFLPRAGCKQFQFSARLWYARLNTSTVVWGTNLAGNAAPQFDLHTELDLGRYSYFSEYVGRFQLRSNWAVRYSFTPIWYQERNTVRVGGGFFFGNFAFTPGADILTKWDRFIHRFDLVYDWFRARHAVSSVFAGYSLYDDKLTISSENLRIVRNRSKSFGMVNAGISLDRVISMVGGAMASVHCKWSVQFLEGYFGWDGYAATRIAVPMNCGRWGFLEAGWRWMVLELGDPTNTDKTSHDGLIGAIGLTF